MKTISPEQNTVTSRTTAPLDFRPKSSGTIPRGLTFASVLIIVIMLAIIMGDIIICGAGTINWEFLTHPPENGMEEGGVFPAIIGTVALVFLMVLAVVPIGVMTAIYLSEYTKPGSRMTRLIRVAINNLAAVPSIVFGLFGLGFFIGCVGGGFDAIFCPQDGPVWGQPAIIWAALTLALLTLPVAIVSTEEALRTIPVEL